jgi:hypothetical protein
MGLDQHRAHISVGVDRHDHRRGTRAGRPRLTTQQPREWLPPTSTRRLDNRADTSKHGPQHARGAPAKAYDEAASPQPTAGIVFGSSSWPTVRVDPTRQRGLEHRISELWIHAMRTRFGKRAKRVSDPRSTYCPTRYELELACWGRRSISAALDAGWPCSRGHGGSPPSTVRAASLGLTNWSSCSPTRRRLTD